MSLNIKNPEVEELARRVAAATGASLTAAVAQALREKLARIEDDSSTQTVAAAEERPAPAVFLGSRLVNAPCIDRSL